VPSLLGKVLAATSPAGPPVPMGESGIWQLPRASSSRGNAEEAMLRAYGRNGTTFSNAALLGAATAGPEWQLFQSAKQDGRQRYSTSDQGSDTRRQVVTHPALNLLSRPNKFWSRFRLFEISQLYQDLTGKCHWVVTKSANMPIGLWPVRPDRMQPVPDRDKYLLGWLYTSPGGAETIALDADEVIYNPLPDPLDSYGGTGPIQSVMTEIDAVEYAAQYNRNFFSNSARPDGVLSVDHRVSDEEWDELTDRWRDAHRGVARAHRVAVLEGVTWVPTSTAPKDMDFPNLMSTGGDRIREALGMHKIMTGLVDDVNRANAQTGEEIFAAWKVAPRLRRWRDVLNFHFLPMFGDMGQGYEFDFRYPMPVNREQDNLELTAKANAALALVTAGYDQSDVLKCVGLPDMKPVLHITDVPALPPRWTTPMAAPAAGGAPDEAGQGAADAVTQLRARAGWDSQAWAQLEELLRQAGEQRQNAAWNSLAGAR
jgi:HK97 family phage portal protein